MMNPVRPGNHRGHGLETFATTHWTQVLSARGESTEARSALAELCEAYYLPVVAFLRGDGRSPDEARELAHEFFARILDRQGFTGADPERGRFRSYLLGAVKHFVQTVRERDGRQKRGGSIEHVSLSDAGGAEGSAETTPEWDVADGRNLSPDHAFDRQWGLTVLNRALHELEQEWVNTGRAAEFEVLKPWLTGENAPYSQAEAGVQLGMSEGAIKVAVHRLRKRFREGVKREIGSTLHASAELADELRHLIAVVGG
jgi:RNA polymerase sigma factor (sigma-70 family)